MASADGDGRAAFRYRDFRLFWCARLTATLASQIIMPTLGWQIYSLTRDPMALGFIGLSIFLPVVAATLPAGQAADRFERRGIYRLCQLGQMSAALTLVLLTIAGVGASAPYYGAAALFGVVRTFAAPASQALTPKLVPLEHYPNAVVWNSSAFQIATVSGPAVAGLVLRFFNEQAAYGLAALLCALLCTRLAANTQQ